jgi:integrase
LVRWRHEAGYRRADVGVADDHLKAGTLDFDAAVRKARKLVDQARTETKAAAEGPALTIGLSVESYMAERDARESRRKGRPVRSDAAQRLGRYVLGQKPRGKQEAIPAAPLAAIALHALKEADLLAWRGKLPETMKATTKQRLINDLKAALNGAYAINREKLPPTMPAVIKHGLKADKADDDEAVPLARENQILSDGAIASLIRAAREIDEEQEWDGDLFRLVVVLAATGARFSQVARMRVADFQRQEQRVLVPVSRKGRGGRSGVVPVPIGNDVLEALLPTATGRSGDGMLLERWRRKQVSGSIRWEKSGRGPWQTSSEIVRPWHDIRERAKLPDIIPYALRHSSIVRGIRANLPIRLVAALHDTSVPMIERHYGRWIADGLEELAARAVVPLMPTEGDNIVPLRASRNVNK